MNIKNFFGACDYSSSSGEGKLARLFIKYNENITQNKFIRISLPKNNKLNYKYILPFIGVIFCWMYFFKKKKIYYINYLPLWNIFLFIFLPPNTKLGPITGGAKYDKKKINIIRKYFFPLFYRISEIFINIRNQRVFSTDLLKKYLSKKTIGRSQFNFILKLFKKKKTKVQKNIDFLIYFRKHKNKKEQSPIDLIKKLSLYGFKINIVGDYLNFNNVKNHGYISNKKLIKLLSKTFFTLPSGENIYSLFVLESIQNNVKILIDYNYYKKIKYYKKSFIKFNHKNCNDLFNLRNTLKQK